jgi:hypothetical protein
VVFLGLISYSLYLWHWSVLSISRWTIGVSAWTAPFQLVLMMLFCIISYKYLELPLRRASWSPSLSRTIVYGVSTSMAAGLLVVFLFANTQYLSLIDENKEMLYKTHWEDWSDCNYVTSPNTNEGGCKYLDNQDYPLRVVVIGDSHAGHLASGLREAMPSMPSSAAMLLYAGCYPVIDSDCPFTRQAFEWVLDDPGIDVVVLAGYHNLVTNGNRLYQSTGDPNTIQEESFSRLEESLRQTVRVLTASQKEVLMIVDSHELLLDPELEVIPINGFVRDPGILDVPRHSVIARNQKYYDLLDDIAAENPHFYVFYSGSVFCDEDVCKSDMDGKPLFQSEDHLTPFGSRLLASHYQAVLLNLLPAR